MTSGIVDSHFHCWQLARGDYHWLTPELTRLYLDYLPNDYLNDSKNMAISQAVLVQAAATEQETAFLLKLATEQTWIKGVVGWLNFEADPSLACHQLLSFCANPKFKGIRPMLQDIADVNWVSNPKFSVIFECLAKLNLTFDALVTSEHLNNIASIAKQYPDLKIVIDHFAKPNISQQQSVEWAKALAQFKTLKNVYIKLSGLPTEADLSQQDQSYFKYYFHHVYCIFGPNRMMWGSDWPVVNINSSFTKWMDLSKQLIAELPPHEQQQILSATAIQFYQL